MTSDQIAVWLAALLHDTTIRVVIPCCLLLGLILMAFYLLRAAQAKPDFNIERMFLDENNKPNVFNFVTLLAFAIHAFCLVILMFRDREPDVMWFIGFGLIWGGTPAAMVLAQKWNGSLPFSKAPVE
jgi:hypothetical protein